jgi:ferritin-like metal-binding protein YciE
MGLTWARGPDGAGRAFGLGPVGKDIVLFLFLNLFLMQKQFEKNLENVLKHQKYSENLKTIPRKFPETDCDTNNLNKVFGAHEKDFRAF